MRDVDGDTDIWMREVATGPGAVPGDLLLDGEGHDDIIRQRHILEEFEGIHQGHATEAVVLGLSREALVHEVADAGREGDGGTDGGHCEDLPTWEPDIDPEFIGANWLVQFVVRHDVDRLESVSYTHLRAHETRHDL